MGHRQLASKQALEQSDSSHQLVSSVLKSGSTLSSAKPLTHVALMIPIKSGSQLINLLFSCDTLPAASMAGMTCPHPPCREWQASLGLASKWHHLLDHVMATPEELSGPCSEQKAVVGGLRRKPRHMMGPCPTGNISSLSFGSFYLAAEYPRPICLFWS